MIIKGISQKPIRLQYAWKEKTVTTTPPIYIPHQEYFWECKLTSDIKFYGIVLLCHKNITEFQKLFTEDAGRDLNVKLSFHPFDWKNSNLMGISLSQASSKSGGGCSTRIENQAFKENPKNFVKIHVLNESMVKTGHLIDLATVHIEKEVTAKLLLIDQLNTESTHGRWRLKKDLREGLSESFKFLKEGRVSGRIIDE